MVDRRCKDCPAGGRLRSAPHPGPRCATHHREHRARARRQAHEHAVAGRYGLEPGDYDRLYRHQGGRCAICQRATGRSKRLAVDHDHKTGEVRGLLCSTCNRFVGRLRDSAVAFARGCVYLADPPARQVLMIESQEEK